nr:cytochrome b6-f complex subunit VI [Timspurckia oligopyrenoides]UNJ17455.1 cytochrome b6-f complex subunit VI [Timspurckia oligopyrenoides]
MSILISYVLFLVAFCSIGIVFFFGLKTIQLI